MLPSRCFLFTFVLSYGRFFKTLFKLVSFSKKTYCLLGIYHSCMKGRRPSYSDATSFDMFQHVTTSLDMLRQVYTGFVCLSKISHNYSFFFLIFFSLFFFLYVSLQTFFFFETSFMFFFHSHCTKLFFSFHSFSWLHYICFFSYVLGSVIIIDWLVVGDFLFFLSLKVFCLLGNMLSF